MKKVFVVSLFTLLSIFLSNAYSTAYSAEGFYIGGNIGIGLRGDLDGERTANRKTGAFDVNLDKGIAVGVAAGHRFDAFRIEGELAYQKNDVDEVIDYSRNTNDALSGDFSRLALLLNCYYDFHNDSKFIPFVMGGMGFVKVKINDLKPDWNNSPYPYNDDSTVFAYQMGVGIGYKVNEKVTIEWRYSYFAAAADLKIGDGSEEFQYDRHNLLLGVRYDF